MRSLSLFLLAFLLGPVLGAQSFYINKKISEPNRSIGSLTGYAVRLSGDYAFISSPESPYDTSGANPIPRSGFVTIYKQDAQGNWNLNQRIQSSTRSNNGQFGWSLDVDDTTLVVGARQELVGTFFNNGTAHVFKLRNGRWVHEQRLIPDDTTAGPFFGESVAVSGTTIVVGAERNRTDSAGNNTLVNAGAAYVYEYINGSWAYQEKLSAGVRTAGYFGRAVEIDGDRIAISAPEEWVQNGVPLGYYGAVYIFDKDNNGNWNESIHIADSSFRGGAKFLVLRDSMLLRPSENYSANPIFGMGAVFYLKLGATSWMKQQTITAANPNVYDGFGWGLSFDGNRLAVSVPNDDENPQGLDTIAGSGSVFLYNYDPQSDLFSYTQTVVASDRGFPLSELDNFSRRAVAIDGLNLLVGCYFDKQDSLNQGQVLSGGSAYFYDTICNAVFNPISDTICFGDSLLFDGFYLTAGGTYRDVMPLAASNGCDSIVDLSLYVIPEARDSIQVQACQTYTTRGGLKVNQSGFYTDTISFANACDSIIVQDVTVNTVDTSVVRMTGGLKAQAQNATFQWIDCQTGQALTGETRDSLIVGGLTQDRFYAVVVTQNGCSDTSYCFKFERDLSLASLKLAQVELFPNPGSGFEIKSPGDVGVSYVEILDVQGRVLHQIDQPKGRIALNLTEGLYQIRGRLNDGRQFQVSWIYEE